MSIRNLLKSETCLNTIKGAYTPEQFGVFLNMYSFEATDNYQVVFHENYHYWQSVFTPFGQSKWILDRSTSSNIIGLWNEATNQTPTNRAIPITAIMPCKTTKQLGFLAKIHMQTFMKQVSAAAERIVGNQELEEITHIPIDELCPKIKVDGNLYKLNGIDIIEGYAKFQEAILVNIIENKPLYETIDSSILNPEYYVSLYYFISRIGTDRILEFPAVCEMALMGSSMCILDENRHWENHYPAWRFIKIIDIISKYTPEEYLGHNLEKDYICYLENTLKKCGYDSHASCWQESISYLSKEKTNITDDIRNAIEFKLKYPWALSYPFYNLDIMIEMKKFHPYYYITSNESRYTVDSFEAYNEVTLENHYQAFAHQICGHPSARCIDYGKIQCGFSYYGIQGCKYQLDGTCDGHIDKNSSLPATKLDDEENIVEGCMFELFLNLMDISIKDLNITNVNRRLTWKQISENHMSLKNK